MYQKFVDVICNIDLFWIFTPVLCRLLQTCTDLQRLAKTCIDLHDTFTHLLSQCQRILQDLEWLSLILVRTKRLAQTFADLLGLTQTCTNLHCTLGYLHSYFQMISKVIVESGMTINHFFGKRRTTTTQHNTTKAIPRRLRFADVSLKRKVDPHWLLHSNNHF